MIPQLNLQINLKTENTLKVAYRKNLTEQHASLLLVSVRWLMRLLFAYTQKPSACSQHTHKGGALPLFEAKQHWNCFFRQTLKTYPISRVQDLVFGQQGKLQAFKWSWETAAHPGITSRKLDRDFRKPLRIVIFCKWQDPPASKIVSFFVSCWLAKALLGSF